MNTTISSAEYFVLFYFPGMQGWISVPFCIIYIITLLGNFTIVLIITGKESLQEPMYLFICMLAIADVILNSAILPRMLVMLWFDITNISIEGCFFQLFFMHISAFVASSFLLAMCFDRYFAVCNPLRYSSVFSSSTVRKILLLCIVRGLIFVTPLPILASTLSYCRSNTLITSYCDYISLIEISCTDSIFYSIYGLLIAFIIIADAVFIIFTYVMILVTVLKLASRKDHDKALSTCSSHLVVVLMTYTTAIFAVVMNTFNQDVLSTVLVPLSRLSIALPGMLNPIIYGIKTKEIRQHALKFFRIK
ncbi:olfactory receptor 52K1-like [Protopterus annectens]|uniref:olfactory receptor 52K1-like n=1 Tax=Protopterus annectens TaxID=7888 RepID=UPI001CFB4753|nr:olfactory receptor 52K1-like [Protopterus annectens]